VTICASIIVVPSADVKATLGVPFQLPTNVFFLTISVGFSKSPKNPNEFPENYEAFKVIK